MVSRHQCLIIHNGPLNSRPNKLVKSNKSISRKNFFCNFKNGRTGKKFKTARNAISQKLSLIYVISRVFLPGLFKIFWPTVNIQCRNTTNFNLHYGILTVSKDQIIQSIDNCFSQLHVNFIFYIR